jgi:uncharacterized protein
MHPNEELVRKGYEAFGKGDIETLNDLFADDIAWNVPGRNQLAGTYRGKDEVLGVFQKTAELTGGTFKLEMHDLLANDDHVVGLIHATGEHDGKKLEDNSVQIFHIKNGKVTEQWLHPGDPYATDEFWG